jgi:hypothetical protein
VGKTDGIDLVSGELTSCALTKVAQNGISRILSSKKANRYIHPLPASELSVDCARHARLARR